MATSQFTETSDAAIAYCDGHGVQLERTAPDGWLAWDLRAPGPRSRLLGCIEELDDQFELMQLGDVFSWTRFDSLLLAVIHLLTHASEGETVGISSPR